MRSPHVGTWEQLHPDDWQRAHQDEQQEYGTSAWRRNELVVDTPHAEQAQAALGAHLLDQPGEAPTTGPVQRLTLTGGEGYDLDKPLSLLDPEAAAERNYLVSRGPVLVSAEGRRSPKPKTFVTGQPKTFGFNTATPAGERFPERPSIPAEGAPVVGILDTGISPHPWLDGRYVASFADRERLDVDPYDEKLDAEAGHGTFLTGLVLEQAPQARVHASRLLSSRGYADLASLAEAISWIADQGVQILNLSLGSYTVGNRPPAILARVLEKLGDDVVVVAASGNLPDPAAADGADVPAGVVRQDREFWPAAFPQVVAVAGAAPRSGWWEIPEWSAYGPWVDFAAPAEEVLSTFVHFPQVGEAFHGWAYWSGTSFSSAIVSGTLARIMSETGCTAREALATLRADAKLPRIGKYQTPLVGVERTAYHH